MATVYFDRNVFADICELRNGLKQKDVEIIKNAIKKKSITILLSAAHLGETLAIIEESEDLVIQHLETIRDLVDKTSMIKHAEMILVDDCLSYSRRIPTRHIIPTTISFKNLYKDKGLYIKFAEKHKKSMDSVADNITKALCFFKESIEVESKRNSNDFKDIWKVQSAQSVERLIAKLPERDKKRCRNRGIEKMLDIPSVLIHSIYTSWFFYSGGFGIQGTPRKVRRNDVIDMIHSVQASATDIFVTQENPKKSGTIPFILNQFQIHSLKLMSLQQFIESLKLIP